MKGKSQSPQDKTQVRIAKDKREFNRLLKKAQKYLVEGHSPVVYDYLDYQLAYADYGLTGADKSMAAAYDAQTFDMETYFTCAEKDTLNTIDIWGKEYQQILHDAEMRSFGYLYEEEDKLEQYFQCARGDVDDGLDELVTIVKDEEDRDEDIIIIFVDDEEDEAEEELDDAEEKGAGFWGSSFDFLMDLPATLVAIQKLILSFVELDPDKFVEDNLQMMKAQQELQKRLTEAAE